MKTYCNTFWFIFTVVLSVTFVVLFSLELSESLGVLKTIIYNLTGLLVIWGVYVVRAHIFKKHSYENEATKLPK